MASLANSKKRKRDESAVSSSSGAGKLRDEEERSEKLMAEATAYLLVRLLAGAPAPQPHR